MSSAWPAGYTVDAAALVAAERKCFADSFTASSERIHGLTVHPNVGVPLALQFGDKQVKTIHLRAADLAWASDGLALRTQRPP